MKTPSVCVVGLGYIGLPTALLLAQAGNFVVGFDTDERKISSLKKKTLPFHENGLEDLFLKVQSKKTFEATAEIQAADTFIIAVPTPQSNGTADLKYILSALELMKPVVKDGDTIVLESTVGPRDCIDHILPIIHSWQKKIGFGHCPERAIPGNTLREMVTNDRIIGSEDVTDGEKIAKLYRTFVKGEVFLTTTTIAAACKVMENTFRAVNIALANEFVQIADALQFNVWEAIGLANHHPRVSIHSPGPGVGGHCIPIDPWFFTHSLTQPTLIEHALRINESMPEYVMEQLKILIKRYHLSKPTVGILGYAYKKNVDDPRESPAESLKNIVAKEFSVMVTDPFVDAKKFHLQSQEEVLKKSDVLILVTDHDVYKEIDFTKYRNITCVLDTRHILKGPFVHYLGDTTQ